MGVSRAGVFNGVTSTILIMMLLSAGLYFVAHNPSTVGFDVQAASFGAKNRQAQADEYFRSDASLLNANEFAVKQTSTANTRPECQQWYETRRGDTQWGLAQRHSKEANKWPWIKGMRWVSGKSPQDDLLKSGEVVCVSWAS